MRTIGDMMTAAAACATEEQAQELVRDEVDSMVAEQPLLLQEEARSLVMKNIGYLAGYFGREEAARILRLFGTRHPYFGAIEDWPRTPEEMLEMGRKVAIRRREEAARGER